MNPAAQVINFVHTYNHCPHGAQFWGTFGHDPLFQLLLACISDDEIETTLSAIQQNDPKYRFEKSPRPECHFFVFNGSFLVLECALTTVCPLPVDAIDSPHFAFTFGTTEAFIIEGTDEATGKTNFEVRNQFGKVIGSASDRDRALSAAYATLYKQQPFTPPTRLSPHKVRSFPAELHQKWLDAAKAGDTTPFPEFCLLAGNPHYPASRVNWTCTEPRADHQRWRGWTIVDPRIDYNVPGFCSVV